MIAAPCSSASSRASDDFPAAVGPQMIRSLPSSKPPLYLFPGEMNNRGPAMYVVRRKSRVAERGKERPHLPLRQLFSSLDCRLAGNRGGETFVLGGSTSDPIAGQSVKRLAQAALRIET